MKSKRNRIFFAISLCSAFTGSFTVATAEIIHEHGAGNPGDWVHFNPKNFQPAGRLVPAEYLVPEKARSYAGGVPAFPHDPTKMNVIFGRGKDKLPTEIYAKAFDIVQVANKYFQAPAAGRILAIVVNGEPITLYGTSWYTPLSNNAYVGNPVQISPFDPTRIFYKEKAMWPSVVYGESGKDIIIAGHKFHIPGPGESIELRFSKDGHFLGSSKNAEKKEDEKLVEAKNEEHKDGSSVSSAEKAAAEKAAAEKAAAEKAAAEKAAAEKAAAEKAATEKAAAEKAAAEKAAAEKAAAEKAAAEKAAAEKAAAEKAAAEKVAAEKAAAEKAAAEKEAAEKAAAEKAAAEKAAAEKTPTENNAAEQSAPTVSLNSNAGSASSGAGSVSGSTGSPSSGAASASSSTGSPSSGAGSASSSTGSSSSGAGSASSSTGSSSSGAGSASSSTGSSSSGAGSIGSSSSGAGSSGTGTAGGSTGSTVGGFGGSTATGATDNTTETQLRGQYLEGGVEEKKTMLTPDEVRRSIIDQTNEILNVGIGEWQRYDQVLTGLRPCIFDRTGSKRLGKVSLELPVNQFFANQMVNPQKKLSINLKSDDGTKPQLINVWGRFQADYFVPTGNRVGEVAQQVMFYTTNAEKVEDPFKGVYDWPIDKDPNTDRLIDPTFGTASVKMTPMLITLVEPASTRNGSESIPQVPKDSGF